jgi:hypothetical protein
MPPCFQSAGSLIGPVSDHIGFEVTRGTLPCYQLRDELYAAIPITSSVLKPAHFRSELPIHSQTAQAWS